MKVKTPRVVYVVVDSDGMPWGDACLNRELAEEERHRVANIDGNLGRLRIRKFRLVPRKRAVRP